MKICLTRGEEKVEIEGDDGLITESLSYQGTFERSVKQITDKFYQNKQQGDQHAGTT